RQRQVISPDAWFKAPNIAVTAGNNGVFATGRDDEGRNEGIQPATAIIIKRDLIARAIQQKQVAIQFIRVQRDIDHIAGIRAKGIAMSERLFTQRAANDIPKAERSLRYTTS